MKGAREYRDWIKRLRMRYGKKNGGICIGLLDNPWMERKHATNKRLVRREKVKPDLE